MYAGGPVETTDSQLVGKDGDPNVDIGFPTLDARTTAPSCRRSSSDPVALPTTVSLDRRMLTEGDEFTVYYNAPGASETTVSVVAEGGDVAASDSIADCGESAGTMAFDTARTRRRAATTS